MTSQDDSVGIAVLGAGPAGLTAAYVLGLRGVRGVVYEADGTSAASPRRSSTTATASTSAAIGSSRSWPIQRLWEEMLGDDFLVGRGSRASTTTGKYFAYPLQARDVVARLGISSRSVLALLLLEPLNRGRERMETFEDWVTAHFGRRLYDAFFRSYTEKVWGIPGSEIRAEWAAQRIKDFSFSTRAAGGAPPERGDTTTLIEEFRYPRLGPGQMWERDAGARRGARRRRCSSTTASSAIRHEHERRARDHRRARRRGRRMSRGWRALEHPAQRAGPEPRAGAARRDRRAPHERLRYRSICLVALVIDDDQPFPDNWIYLHDPGTRAGRVQNFGAWSPDLVKPGTTCLGVEYFCFEGDEIWEMSDEEAVALATDELARIGLVESGRRHRRRQGARAEGVPDVRPRTTERRSPCIHGYLAGFENLKTFGRNGLHRYNNQDHSMWTAILATLNLVDGTDYDVWSVNTEAEYHEEGEVVDELLDIELVG